MTMRMRVHFIPNDSCPSTIIATGFIDVIVNKSAPDDIEHLTFELSNRINDPLFISNDVTVITAPVEPGHHQINQYHIVPYTERIKYKDHINQKTKHNIGYKKTYRKPQMQYSMQPHFYYECIIFKQNTCIHTHLLACTTKTDKLDFPPDIHENMLYIIDELIHNNQDNLYIFLRPLPNITERQPLMARAHKTGVFKNIHIFKEKFKQFT